MSKMLQNLTESTESETEADTTTLRDMVDTHSPNPDHTMRFVENSGWVDREKVRALLEAFEDGREEELVDAYEGYREIIDLERAVGGATDISDSFSYYESDGDGNITTDRVPDATTLEGWSENFEGPDNKVRAPFYAWNKKRKEKAITHMGDLPGNLPAYRAVYPEPQTDDMVCFEERDVSPSGSDSHIWVPEWFMDSFEECEYGIPPETVAELREARGADTSEETDTSETTADGSTELLAICGRPKADGTPCETPVAEEGESCQHHSGEQLATHVTKEDRELVGEVEETADTPEETDTSEEDTTEETADNPLEGVDLDSVPESMQDKIAEKVAEKLVN